MKLTLAAAALFAASALPAAAQIPDPAKAINAAKAAKAATEAADRKNSDALDPQRVPPVTANPATPPATATASATPPAEPDSPLPQGPGGGYTYDPAGRRDPFVSLLGRGEAVNLSAANRPAGLPGVLINEVSVKGIFRSDKGFIALLQTPDGKTYIVQTGVKMLDGSVKAIAQDAVVFSQDVNDPLSLVKQREVRKSIRPQG